MSATQRPSAPSVKCEDCDLWVPREDVSRAIHLQRHHPDRYQSVVDEHLREMRRRNDRPQHELRTAPDEPLAADGGEDPACLIWWAMAGTDSEAVVELLAEALEVEVGL